MNPLSRLIGTGTQLFDAGMSEIEALILRLVETDDERAADDAEEHESSADSDIEDRVAHIDDEFDALQPEEDVIVSPPPTGAPPAYAMRTSGGSFAAAPDMESTKAVATATTKTASKKTTAAKKPASKKSAATTPTKASGAKKPAAKKKAVTKKPAAKKPATKQPASKTAPKKATPKKTAPKKSAAKKSATQKTAAKKSAAKKSAAKKPHQPDIVVGASGVAPILTVNPNLPTRD